jgi:hypothetical protein
MAKFIGAGSQEVRSFFRSCMNARRAALSCETVSSLDYAPHAREERAALLISGFASVDNFGVPALTRAQERVRSPVTSTATPVSAAAAKQQH